MLIFKVVATVLITMYYCGVLSQLGEKASFTDKMLHVTVNGFLIAPIVVATWIQ